MPFRAHPRTTILLGVLAVVLGLAGDLAGSESLEHVAALVLVVGGLSVVAVLLPGWVARDRNPESVDQPGPDRQEVTGRRGRDTP